MPEAPLSPGPALRRLRKREGLTQAAMAQRLGISPSYLALLERNQRPVSARVLVELVDQFEFDPLHLREAESIGGVQGLARRLADERFSDLGIDRDEAVEFLSAAPQAAAAFARLFDQAGEQGSGVATGRSLPLDGLRQEVERWRNHFADLDLAAEELADEMRLSRADIATALTDRLRERHQLTLRILPQNVMPGLARRLDLHARQVQLSEMLDPAARQFELALQLVELEHGDELTNIAKGARLDDEAVRVLFRRHLADYFADALVMPYGRFLRACEATSYDLAILQRRFGVGVEQLARRLTTLQRMGQRGLPFFMAKVDRAGQFSARVPGASGTTLLDNTFGCPLWHVHHGFERPDTWWPQAVMQEEGGAAGPHWITFSHFVRASSGAETGEYAIVLGIEARFGETLAPARGMALDPAAATPIGPGCARCHRTSCTQRSLPPVGATLALDRTTRPLTPYLLSDPGSDVR
ncbi:ImmA/IrrE family metallo-endopeptidase [Erythrobacter sp. 3-20A1M]|uniref:helix-turn-helix domain-containing protein n=1 Tax=Erythrobacter sp. 3-20A1M TaxID=2653850 RepID=UPI001BFCC695|nr:XRE family transcriptional regulator [Erythrobacter sp. 3-20A1M]QWC58032.1 ImmA/IrrE family metallo-endopeptidase [Erythrobacter sp. 3-20A1M]